MSGDAARWLDYAGQDLRLAELALGEKLWNQACFHAQQGAEKALKARLAARGDFIPRTHKIADLLRLLGREDIPDDLTTRLYRLDRFYLPARYPDALPDSAAAMIGEHEAREAMETARQLYGGFYK